MLLIMKEKHRDKNGNIIGYTLVDKTGKVYNPTSLQLKDAIEGNKVSVINLKLTSDNRLIEVDRSKELDSIIQDAESDKKISCLALDNKVGLFGMSKLTKETRTKEDMLKEIKEYADKNRTRAIETPSEYVDYLISLYKEHGFASPIGAIFEMYCKYHILNSENMQLMINNSIAISKLGSDFKKQLKNKYVDKYMYCDRNNVGYSGDVKELLKYEIANAPSIYKRILEIDVPKARSILSRIYSRLLYSVCYISPDARENLKSRFTEEDNKNIEHNLSYRYKSQGELLDCIELISSSLSAKTRQTARTFITEDLYNDNVQEIVSQDIIRDTINKIDNDDIFTKSTLDIFRLNTCFLDTLNAKTNYFSVDETLEYEDATVELIDTTIKGKPEKLDKSINLHRYHDITYVVSPEIDNDSSSLKLFRVIESGLNKYQITDLDFGGSYEDIDDVRTDFILDQKEFPIVINNLDSCCLAIAKTVEIINNELANRDVATDIERVKTITLEKFPNIRLHKLTAGKKIKNNKTQQPANMNQTTESTDNNKSGGLFGLFKRFSRK